jgi:hypothetical protein
MGCGNLCLRPRRWGIPKKKVMVPKKVYEKFSSETGEMERGVRAMGPACCLPLWAREGVTVITFPK